MAESTTKCAVSTCENEARPPAEPVRVWIVDTYPAEHISLGFILCHEHAAKASWSM